MIKCRKGFIIQFSPSRLVLGAVMLGVILCHTWLSVKAFTDKRWLASAVSNLALLVSDTRRIILSTLALTVVVIGGLALLSVSSSDRLPDLPYVLQIALERLYPAQIWATLAAV